MSELLKRGRIRETRKDVVAYISSARADQRIAEAVVKINEAHALMLANRRIVPKEHARRMLRSLAKLENALQVSEQFEDVHVQVEEQVSKEVGAEIGGNMSLGKSRNDQVATAIRYVLRAELLQLSSALIALLKETIAAANRHTGTLFLAYTHTQPAQPTTFAHFLLAHAQALLRDQERLSELYARVNLSPMGSGAIVGTSYGIDRNFVAKLLGFDGLIENTIDATGSRDFVLETQASLAILASNVSRLCQDLIFFNSQEVGLIELPDEFTSTSSIMPQKKNPDFLEATRARCAKVYGNFTETATVLHSLLSGYNLDLQEITPPLWGSLDSLNSALRLLGEIIPRIHVSSRVSDKPEYSFTMATELANMIAKEAGLPFREAHRVVGRAVRELIEQNRSLGSLTTTELQSIARQLMGRAIVIPEGGVKRALDPSTSVEATITVGGPSIAQVRGAAGRLFARVKRAKSLVEARMTAIDRCGRQLSKMVRRF